MVTKKSTLTFRNSLLSRALNSSRLIFSKSWLGSSLNAFDEKDYQPHIGWENSRARRIFNRIKTSLEVNSWALKKLLIGLSFGLFYLIFIFTPLKSWLEIRLPLGSIYTYFVPVLLVVMAASLVLYRRIKFTPTYVDLALMLLVVSILVSNIISYFVYRQPLNIIYESLILLSYLAIFFIARFLFASPRQVVIFLYTNICLAFVLALYGIWQYLHGIATPLWVENYSSITTRIFSTLNNPLILAGYLNIMLFATLSLFIGAKGRAVRVGLAAVSAVLLLALALTFSRGAWIGLIVGLLFFFLIYDIRWFIAMITTFLISLVFLPASLFQRLSDVLGSQYQNISAVSGRIWSLSNVLHILPHHLLFGVGLGMYGGEVAFSLSPSIVYMEGIQGGIIPIANTDNQFLQVLIQQGVVGFLLFCALIIAVIYTGLVITKKSKDKKVALIALGITASFVAFIVQAIFADVLQFPQMSLLMFALVGILLALPEMEKLGGRAK